MKTSNIITALSLSTISSLTFAVTTGPIVQVSEPSTFALFAISAVTLFLIKRNKK